MITAQAQREQLRTAALEWLHDRPSNAFDAEILTQRLNRSGLIDFPVEIPDVTDAIQFLRGSGFVEAVPHSHGATLFYRITSAGQLAHERGTLTARPL